MQRRKLFARLLGVEPARAAAFDSWADCWQAIAAFLGDRRHILILDEFTYAVESDPAIQGRAGKLPFAVQEVVQRTFSRRKRQRRRPQRRIDALPFQVGLGQQQ